MRSGPAFFVLALTVAPALAEPFQNTYYCVGEAAGGLIYDTALKRWRGTNFRTEEKFVLKFSKSGEHFEPSWINKDGQQTVFEYDVTLTKSGSNDFSKCISLSGKDKVLMYEPYSYMTCESSITEYQFNFRTNRYLGAYLVGYLNGTDDNLDTPSVTAGTCTPIQY